jgi:hypothetical protein
MKRPPAAWSTGKPDLRELLGIAVNAARLVAEEGRETHLDRIAALGLAQHETGEPLSALLWRAKYGKDMRALSEAMRQYAEHLPAAGERAYKLAALVIVEWIDERCSSCGGVGLQSIAGKKRMRPRVGQGPLWPCKACSGTGRAQVNHHSRARLLNLTGPEYQAGKWPRQFAVAVRNLRVLAAGLTYPLRSVLRGDNVHASLPPDNSKACMDHIHGHLVEPSEAAHIARQRSSVEPDSEAISAAYATPHA